MEDLSKIELRPESLNDQKATYLRFFMQTFVSPSGKVYEMSDRDKSHIHDIEAMDHDQFAMFRNRLRGKSTWKDVV